MPQQVEMKSGQRNKSAISDNNNKQHISNQNEAMQSQSQQRQQRSRQQQQHIYENLPASATSQQLRKYFRREAIYENLCRGCGYGVFAAQGRYCHFCQCIVSGSVVAALQQQQQPQQLTPTLTSLSSSSECNIYENICELCRGIYSDSEQCECASSAATPTPTPTKNTPQLKATPTLTSTPTEAAAAAGKAGKSRSLLGYSKSSAATLTRLFGSLKQLNRSSSLQRRLFQREGGKGGGGGGSLEIIHNVDEVFRTQETFDMQRICELKHQLQCSRSDQHIYGRLRAEREIEPEPKAEPEPEQVPERPAEKRPERETRKKPRLSAIRLLRHGEQQQQCSETTTSTSAATATASLYLNESICQWMNALRRELHSYEDVNGGVTCQQPKSVPPAYEREREREREPELVMLRRSELTTTTAAATTTTTTSAATATYQQSLVNDFKRKLLAKREQQRQRQLAVQLKQQLELSDRRRRRCGINERHDAAFVTEFLSGLDELKVESKVSAAAQSTSLAATKAALPACNISLERLWQSAAIAASLHGSVLCYFGCDKLLSAFLHHSQRRQRLRSSDKFNIERWLRRCVGESAASRSQQKRRLGPPSLELAVVPATPASDDVAVASCRVGSDNETRESQCERERERESANESKTKTRSNSSVAVGSASMAAPKQSGNAERDSSSDDSENNNSYNNNNNTSNNNNNKERDNGNQQQQQQQLQTAQNRVIKVRRPAPQVPVRNPNTALSNPRNENTSNNNNNISIEIENMKDVQAKQEKEVKQADDEEEESIYQTIWQYKTLEPVPDNDDEEFEIITAAETVSDDDGADDAEGEVGVGVGVDVDMDDAAAETLALQAAAAFAAGARCKLTKQATTTTTATATEIATPATSPLPSPTASMDHGAWETDDEFMFEKASEQSQRQQQQQQQQQRQLEESESEREMARERERAETLSMGSTVTNSTATLGSISSAGGSSIDSGSGRGEGRGRVSDGNAANATLLTHPILRNICIFYSLSEPQKYSAIFYDYQLSQVHQRFMTRIRRPAPPPPLPTSASASTTASAPAPKWKTAASASATSVLISPSNDDSGCSCEADNDNDDIPESIPRPLKEDWEMALLAAAASSKRGVAARAGRKLRVRSSGRLLIPTSVLAWRETLQDVNCCEDEEDMIVPVTDILRAQQIDEDNEVQQTQQTTILNRFKSASIGNLVDLPGEDDKKSIKNRMRMKFSNGNVFRLNRSPKSEKKSRTRRSQVNSLCLDEQSKYPLFGARLKALELNMSDHPYVPRFVVDVCAHIEQPDCIEQDGLYRASGNKLLVDELKRKLTHLYDPRLLRTDDINTLTSLHKQFFRELPAPLITQEAYERLGRLTDDAAIERMRLAFDEMPEPNRSTLRFLIKHLTNVAAASASNRMPASNLAIVWGPCLLAANDISFDIGRMNMLAKVLIENYDRIFRPDNERLVC